jgi:hypothetical protein
LFKIQADALLSRSINQLQLNQYLKAAWNLKSCWTMYDNLMKQNTDKEGKSSLHPEIQEHLKFGVGLFYVRNKIFSPFKVHYQV